VGWSLHVYISNAEDLEDKLAKLYHKKLAELSSNTEAKLTIGEQIPKEKAPRLLEKLSKIKFEPREPEAYIEKF
jgi:hypothetical protein